MDIQCKIKLHSGGRRSKDPYTISFKVPLAAAAGVRTISHHTLAQRCSAALDIFNKLLPHQIRFAIVNEVGWWPTNEDQVVVEQQTQLDLDVMVVPTALHPGLEVQPPCEVRLIDLVTGPIPWFGSTSTSHSSTDITYTKFRMREAPWAPEDVMSVLTDKLGERVLRMPLDPRILTGNIKTNIRNEDQLNTQFDQHVCQLVALVLREIGIPVVAYKNDENRHPGVTDFTFRLGPTADSRELLEGEGQCAQGIVSSDVSTRRPAKQLGYYIKGRSLSYGFLTFGQGICGAARFDTHLYAFTEVIPWHKTGEGVLAYLTYMLLKQLAIETENLHDDGIWVPTGKQQLQPPFPLPPGLGGPTTTPSAAASGPAAAAAGPAAAAVPAATHKEAVTLDAWPAAPAAAAVQHGQSASLPLGMPLASSSSIMMPGSEQYLQLEEDELYLADIVVGRSQSGPVKLGMLQNNGIWCAVKTADPYKQKQVVESMKHEFQMFKDERVVGLQGEILPVYVACGYWDEGNVFFTATTYLDSCKKPSPATQAARPVAVKALQRLHGQGLLHGDIREDNVLLRQVSSEEWQAYFVDLGMCCNATDDSQYEEEISSLIRLFRESDSGSAEIQL